MEIIEIISERLISIDEDFESLKPFMQEYLVKIEHIIQCKTEILNEAIEVLKNNVFSVSSISKELGCSRTNMYNHNQLLKRYIEASESIFIQNNPYTLCEDLKASKIELQRQIALMEDRDIQIEIIKQNNAILERTIIEKEKDIERLQARNSELSTENYTLRTNPQNKQPSVLNIKDFSK